MELTKAYRHLVERVRKLDCAAADYMIAEAPKLPSFDMDGELGGVFIWAETPQGNGYWAQLNSQLAANMDMCPVEPKVARKRKTRKARVKLSEEYHALVEKVRAIDEDAADYLLNRAPELALFTDTANLMLVFPWSSTPQGHEYWARINDSLEIAQARAAEKEKAGWQIGASPALGVRFGGSTSKPFNSPVPPGDFDKDGNFGAVPRPDDFYQKIAEGYYGNKPTNPKDAIGSDKLPLHLWPETATIYGCLALLDGALKYGRGNFRAIGVKPSIYVDALRRHVGAWFEGEDIDPDSGLPHLAHALACLAILVDAQAAGKLNDDRQLKGGYRKMVTELTPHVKRLKELHADKAPKHYTIADNDGSPENGRLE